MHVAKGKCRHPPARFPSEVARCHYVGARIVHKQRAVQDEVGNVTIWGRVEPDLLYGPEGWCEAARPKRRCACLAIDHGPSLSCPTVIKKPHKRLCCGCMPTWTCSDVMGATAGVAASAGAMKKLPAAAAAGHVICAWPSGYCELKLKLTLHRCHCVTDGTAGQFCDQPTEMLCANQCSGHGQCWFGFCRCHDGFWGHDCAHWLPANGTDGEACISSPHDCALLACCHQKAPTLHGRCVMIGTLQRPHLCI